MRTLLATSFESEGVLSVVLPAAVGCIRSNRLHPRSPVIKVRVDLSWRSCRSQSSFDLDLFSFAANADVGRRTSAGVDGSAVSGAAGELSFLIQSGWMWRRTRSSSDRYPRAGTCC